MSVSADGLEEFAGYFEAMLADISPARRKLVARKIGQRLRRSNLTRVAANVEPDGSAMEPRKPRPDRKGKMFRKLRYARNLQIRPNDEGVELRFRARSLGSVAAVHQFGLEGFVGKTRTGETIRARYPARRLLGFGGDDLDAIADELLKWLDRD